MAMAAVGVEAGAGVAGGGARVAAGEGMTTAGVAVDFFFRGVLVEYLLRGKKSRIRMFSSVDSESDSLL
jgi:hypothetical protein